MIALIVKMPGEEPNLIKKIPLHWRANNSKAQKLLGWRPKHSLSASIAETIDWFVKNEC